MKSKIEISNTMLEVIKFLKEAVIVQGIKLYDAILLLNTLKSFIRIKQHNIGRRTVDIGIEDYVEFTISGTRIRVEVNHTTNTFIVKYAYLEYKQIEKHKINKGETICRKH